MRRDRRQGPTSAVEDVDVDGLTVRLHTDPGAGRAYVLVHGIGMSSRYLRRLHDELTGTGAAVASVDLPGFGGLPRPRGDVDIPVMAETLGRALDHAGIGPAVLVGQSMGTQWVTELAARRPDLAQAVALIGPVADERHRTAMRQASALALDTLREPPGANLLVFTDYVRCGIPWYLTQLRHMLAYPMTERVAALRVPALVLRGGADPIAGEEWARRLQRAAASGSLATVPGHAHNVQHSAPRAVASALAAFAAGMLP